MSRAAPNTPADREATEPPRHAASPAHAAGTLVSDLIAELEALRSEITRLEAEHGAALGAVAAPHRASARNLLHYLGLRTRDLRPLQDTLASLGLSSLGRAEAHVLDNLNAVLALLDRAAGRTARPAVEPPESVPSRAAAFDLSTRNAERLLGAAPPQRGVRIMVTMPSEAATNPHLIRELLAAGMDCLRINCAHDSARDWSRMLDHLARAKAELGRDCRVLMDLAGPKLRTGALEPGPEVIEWRPRRDDLGRVVAPTRIWLTPEAEPQVPTQTADALLPLGGEWIAHLRAGDRLSLRDARDKRRELTVLEGDGPSRWAEAVETAYVVSGTPLKLHTTDGRFVEGASTARVGRLPAAPRHLLLQEGDYLRLTASPLPGHAARYAGDGRLLEPATIPCTLPEVFEFVRPGHRIWFDDGKIGGVVREAAADGLLVEITRSRPKGLKLRADKGINLPDSRLLLPPLTAKDLEDLEFVARHADLVGYSFVQQPHDVINLQRLLAERNPEPPGIVLKIETRAAFEQLPHLLLAAMRGLPAGVMIARGDLAVECGYERLAEVQEEILWVCEAAHMPVIWATQVLESYAQNGMPSRAEITDAAMGVRAECVMLNKGPYIVETVRALDDILRRMQGHQVKKTPVLRPLGLARSFAVPSGGG